MRCKVVALIKSDAIDKALSAIQAFKGLPIDLRFYKVSFPVLKRDLLFVYYKEIFGEFYCLFKEKRIYLCIFPTLCYL